jgi:sugar (pentulose or hexulose) kinase
MLAGGVRDVPVPDEAGRLWISPMQAAARWVHEAHCGEAGALVAWVADLLGSAPAGLAEEAARGQPGSGGVVVVDPFPSTATNFTLIKRGVLTFPAPVIALGRPRADVARAVLEGIAFGARAGLDLLGDLASLSAAGGVTRSEAFARALAGSSERAVTVATEPASSALGAAIVAAARHHGGVEAAVGAMADAGREVAPVASDGYPAHYALWRERAEDAARGAMRIGDIV